MRKIIIGCCAFLFLWIGPTSVQAHLAGQPPFFLINGTYTGFYPVYVTSLKDFILPQDTAPENYLVNQTLYFEIDSKMLPFPQSVIDKTTFSWDFGDGTKADGLTANHTYTKMGSFLLTVTADYGDYKDPNAQPILQAILLNIVPTKDYKLPKAIILVNGKPVIDPNKSVPLSEEPITFDASSSIQGSAKITSILWDIGNGKSTDRSTFKYSFSDSQETYIFPMLRVTDANGFINDTFVQLERSAPTPKSKLPILPLGLLFGFNILLIGGVFILLKKF